MRNRLASNSRSRSLLKQLNGHRSLDVYEAAKEIWQRDDPLTLPFVIKTLKNGKRVMNRTAAAFALELMRGKNAIPALECSIDDKNEHPKVRGQAAESLAHSHREKSHLILIRNLDDPSKEVRFWCAYALGEMRDHDALVPLRKLAKEDRRIVRGFWSVSREAKAAIRNIQKEIRNGKGRSRRGCIFCPKSWKKGAQGR
jgi:HEAT repeat protein